MADTLQLSGTWTATPTNPSASGVATFTAAFDELQTLDNKQYSTVQLAADAPVVVDFVGVTAATVVIVKSDNPINVLLTTADVTDQDVAVDSFLAIMSATTPYSGLKLVRQPGQATEVLVFLGEQAI